MYGIFNILLRKTEKGNFAFDIQDQQIESDQKLSDTTFNVVSKYLDALDTNKDKMLVGVVQFEYKTNKVYKRIFTYMNRNSGFALSLMYQIKYEVNNEFIDTIVPLHYSEISKETDLQMLAGVIKQVHKAHIEKPFLHGTYLGVLLQNCKNNQTIAHIVH